MTKNNRDKWLSAKLPLFAAVAMVCSQTTPAWAAYDAGDNAWISPAIDYWYDSNVFRLADTADTQSSIGSSHREDYIFQPKVTGHVQTEVSRQRFYYDGSLFTRHYQEHSDLDYLGTTNALGWDWVVGSDWSGNLQYSNVRDLSAFEDISAAEKDMRTANKVTGSAAYNVLSDLQLFTDGEYDKEHHSTRSELNLNDMSIGGGIRYLTASGNSIAYRHDYNQIDYDEAYNSSGTLLTADQRGYVQEADQLILMWLLGSDIQSTLNIGRATWDYDDATTKNKSSFGGINFKWAYSPKTTFEVGYQKQLSVPNQSLYTSMSNEYKAEVTWKPTEKLKLTGTYNYTKQNYTGSYVRTDKIDFYRFSSEWQPILNWTVLAYWQKQHRDSDLVGYIYSADTIGMNVQYKF